MLYTIFQHVLNMSIMAGYCVSITLLARFFLKYHSRRYCYILWLLTFFTICLPVFIPYAITLPIHNSSFHQIALSDDAVLPFSNASPYEAIDSPVTDTALQNHPMIRLTDYLPHIWLLGILLLVGSSLLSYLHLKKLIQHSAFIDTQTRSANNLKNAIVFGFIHPFIYIPDNITGSARECVLAHERYHIKRKDYVIQVLVWLLVLIDWFNPLMWFAYLLFVKDMELSCDEGVLNTSTLFTRKTYATALLNCAIHSRDFNPVHVSFGSSNLKKRIKNALHYKKPGRITSILGIVILCTTAIGLVLRPSFLSDITPASQSPSSNESLSAENKPEATTLPYSEDTAANHETVTISTPILSTDSDFGADGVLLDYADQRYVIFHSTIGLFVYDQQNQEVIRAINLEPIGCQWTQGDSYCEVSVDKDGKTIYLHPISEPYMYVYDIAENEMIKDSYLAADINAFTGLVQAGDYPTACTSFTTAAVLIHPHDEDDYYVYLSTDDNKAGNLLCWSANNECNFVFDVTGSSKKSAFIQIIEDDDSNINPPSSYVIDDYDNIWLEEYKE